MQHSLLERNQYNLDLYNGEDVPATMRNIYILSFIISRSNPRYVAIPQFYIIRLWCSTCIKRHKSFYGSHFPLLRNQANPFYAAIFIFSCHGLVLFNIILKTGFGRLQRLLNLLHQHMARRQFRQILRYLDACLVELQQFDLFIAALCA